MTPSTPSSAAGELRTEIEQEINTIAAGVSRDELPESLGILIPSLDLQRAIDRIMRLIEQECLRARVDEIEKMHMSIAVNSTPMVFPMEYAEHAAWVKSDLSSSRHDITAWL